MNKYTAEQIAEIVEKHRKWARSEAGGQRADLQGAYLQGADLQRADLRGADLQGAYLQGADLQGAYLRSADLQRADLQGAYLRSAYLRGAYLRGADLQGAYLRGADLQPGETKINWASHALLAEILLRVAGEDVQKRMVAGLIAVSLDWCWDQFLTIEHDLSEWALTEFARWLTEADGAPDVVRQHKKD